MPELPEVETMVRDLRERVIGRSIVSIAAPYPGSVTYPTYDEFVTRVTGAAIRAVERRGKYASFALAGGDALIIHRGMTGSLLYRRPTDPPEPHLRVRFRLDDSAELRFRDQRKFGRLFVMEAGGSERPLPWSAFGPEPLHASFSRAGFRHALQGRRAPIKPLLLGQRVVAGLGNIYVDEALHQARIHPLRPAGELRPAETARLHAAIRDVLSAAVARRGTTFDSYTDLEGRAGGYQGELRVFHRTGEPCPRCGTPVERLVVAGRGTHVCSHCQRL